jgi:soluble lytic murein transglycosylase-like protein
MKLLAILIAAASTALAGEYAMLASGQQLRVDHHERTTSKVTLYYANGGSTTLDASAVISFEAEEYVAPAPVAPPQLATAPAPVAPPTPVDPRSLVTAAAHRTAIPERLLHSLVKAESGYRPDAISPKGAIGLMQLMPATASQYGADAHNPAENVEAGTAYLRDLLLKYNGDVNAALAAYNAGPGAVDKYHGVPPYAETRSYVGRVIRNYLNTPQPAPAQ